MLDVVLLFPLDCLREEYMCEHLISSTMVDLPLSRVEKNQCHSSGGGHGLMGESMCGVVGAVMTRLGDDSGSRRL